MDATVDAHATAAATTVDKTAQPEPTPILDRLAPLPPGGAPRSRRRWALVFGLAFWLSLALGVGARRLHSPSLEPLRRWILEHVPALFPDEWTGVGILAVLIPLLLVVPTAIAVHEVGHMLAGLCAGFRFCALRIGPLQIDRPFRLSLQRIKGTGYAGWVNMFPTRHDHLALRAAVLVAGGPGINLLSAGVLLSLPFARGLFTGAFILVSLALAVKELLPLRHRIAVSDGRRLLMLLRDRAWSERWLALMALAAEMNRNVRPEAMSKDWLAQAVAFRDDSPETVTAHGLAYAAAFHRHEDPEAARCLEVALHYAGFAAPVQREALMSEAAYFQARRRGCIDLAEQWLAQMPQPPLSPWLHWRVEAAILHARGEIDAALKKVDEIDAVVRTWPDRARRDMLLALLAKWRSEIRGAPTAGSPPPS